MKCYGFSLGCKVNAYETSSLLGALKEKGYAVVNTPEEADVILLNTCAVTGTASQKSRQHMRRFRRLAPNAILVAMGCYTKEVGEDALNLGADIVAGTEMRKEILEAIEEFQKDHQKKYLIPQGRPKGAYEELLSFSATPLTRAYLKIQDGCDKFCSYCAIPSLRGKSRSRTPENIFYEIKSLLSKGVKEIILSGVEIGYYGKDFTDRKYDLANLLKDIFETFPELPRLRISSLDESEITDSFLDSFRKYPSFMPHFHLSLQSGSSSVLKRMRRRYDTESYFKSLEKLRSIQPDVAITTDIIVGFPLETEEEWKETLAFAKKCRFAEIHVFPFSKRKGTYAATLEDVPAEIKKRRVRELLSLSKEMRREYETRFFNQKLPVLFEEYDEKKKIAIGHTPNYLLVAKQSEVSLNGEIEEVLYTKENTLD